MEQSLLTVKLLHEEVRKYMMVFIKLALAGSASRDEAAQHLGIGLATLVRRKRTIRDDDHL
jgi:transcriptional regulator with PAS, ATPase and Fis domain